MDIRSFFGTTKSAKASDQKNPDTTMEIKPSLESPNKAKSPKRRKLVEPKVQQSVEDDVDTNMSRKRPKVDKESYGDQNVVTITSPAESKIRVLPQSMTKKAIESPTKQQLNESKRSITSSNSSAKKTARAKKADSDDEDSDAVIDLADTDDEDEEGGGGSKVAASARKKKAPSSALAVKVKRQRTSTSSGGLTSLPASLQDRRIAVTGVFRSTSREAIEEHVRSLGGIIAGNISGKTAFLLVGYLLEDGRAVKEGSKYRTAKEKGVLLVEEESFLQSFPIDAAQQAERQQQPMIVAISRAPTVVTVPSKEGSTSNSNSNIVSGHHSQPKPLSASVSVMGSTSNSNSSSSSSSNKIQHPPRVAPVSSSLWVDRYRPVLSKDLVGHNDTVKKLGEWLRSYHNSSQGSSNGGGKGKAMSQQQFKAALLSGPPGIGKTSLTMIVCRENGYEDILELNASDSRNKREIEHRLIEAVTSRTINNSSNSTMSSSNSSSNSSNSRSQRRVIIMDEVDGMGGGDRGGLAELIRILKTLAKVPIICICNDRQSTKIRSLANHCLDLRARRPTKQTIAVRLQEILGEEGITGGRITERNWLENLVESSGNDIRAAINTLQMQCTLALYGSDKATTSNNNNNSTAASKSSNNNSNMEKDKVLRLSAFDAAQTILNTSNLYTTNKPGGGGGGVGTSSNPYNSVSNPYNNNSQTAIAPTTAKLATTPAIAYDNSIDERYQAFFVDYSLVPLLVCENYVDAFKHGALNRTGNNQQQTLSEADKLDALATAAHRVSDLDRASAALRMDNNQHWELLPFQGIMTLAVGRAALGFVSFPAFPQWLGKHSARAKRQRLIKEITHHMALSTYEGSNNKNVRLDMVSYLRSRLIQPLLKDSSTTSTEAITEVCNFLEAYGLTKEDFTESMADLILSTNEQEKLKTSWEKGVDSQVKAAFTRHYNGMSHTSITTVQPLGNVRGLGSKKSGKKAAGSTANDDDEMYGEEGDDDEAAVVVIDDDEEDEEELAALRAKLEGKSNKGSKSSASSSSKKKDGAAASTATKEKSGKK